MLAVLCGASVASNAAASQAACGDMTEFCNVEPSRKGSSMLQTQDRSKAASTAASSPLKVKVDVLEGDMAKVKTKVAALEAAVGNQVPTAASAATAALLVRQGPNTAYAPTNSYTASAGLSQLQIDGAIDGAVDTAQQQQYPPAYAPQQLVQGYRQDPAPAAAAAGAGGPLKVRVSSLETGVSDMRSRIMSLENEVNGKGASAVLLQKSSDELGDASLKGRIMSMETTVDDLKTRVSSLEHTVLGSAPTA